MNIPMSELETGVIMRVQMETGKLPDFHAGCLPGGCEFDRPTLVVRRVENAAGGSLVSMECGDVVIMVHVDRVPELIDWLKLAAKE